MLNSSLAPSANEPLKWHIPVATALERAGYPQHALIINLKPDSRTPNLSLYEVMGVWGSSSAGWTPIMFHLQGLFIDEDPTRFNDRDFRRAYSDIEDPIFSMMYLHGTVREGKIFGPWTPPRPGATNSVLLWPDTLQYFSGEAAKLIP